MSEYLNTYREWKMLHGQIKRTKLNITPEKFQELKKRERQLLIKLNQML